MPGDDGCHKDPGYHRVAARLERGLISRRIEGERWVLFAGVSQLRNKGQHGKWVRLGNSIRAGLGACGTILVRGIAWGGGKSVEMGPRMMARTAYLMGGGGGGRTGYFGANRGRRVGAFGEAGWLRNKVVHAELGFDWEIRRGRPLRPLAVFDPRPRYSTHNGKTLWPKLKIGVGGRHVLDVSRQLSRSLRVARYATTFQIGDVRVTISSTGGRSSEKEILQRFFCSSGKRNPPTCTISTMEAVCPQIFREW
jgi:hypothetical protein